MAEKPRGGCCHFVLYSAFVVAFTAAFVLIGALGPPSTIAAQHEMYMCVVPSGYDVVWGSYQRLIDAESCSKDGSKLEDTTLEDLKYYPPESVVFYTVIPYNKRQVMSNEFHFLLADIGIHFSTSDYPLKLTEYDKTMLRFEVALGYRDKITGPWSRLASGNVTRTLQCAPNKHKLFKCQHLPLFELGSCAHRQYVVNLVFPSLPLGNTREEFKGVAPIAKLNLYEVHQSPGFTRLWIYLKLALFPLTSILVTWFLFTAAAARETSSIDRLLAALGVSLVFYNAPLDLLSLYYDCPWLIVVNDFRQGLFIAMLCIFWIVFVSEHQEEPPQGSLLHCYWKQLGVVSVAATFLFVYEFCERGIQVVYPFYSLWSNWLSRAIAWVFVGVAAAALMVYAVLFIVTVAKVYWNLRKKQSALSDLSLAAQQRLKMLFFRLKFFLGLTLVVAMASVSTVLLPSTELLLHWQQGRAGYSFYTAVLTGNYGLWNAYVIAMLLLHSPRKPGEEQSSSSSDEDALQRMLTKTSQE